MMRSPWFGISLAIAGLVVGYSSVVLQDGNALAAWECPLMEECKGENCAKHDACASGECSKDCPGNCDAKES